MKKKNQIEKRIKKENKLIWFLRNFAGYLLFVTASFLISVFTGYLSVFISDKTIYAGGKMPMYILIIAVPTLLVFGGLALRKFNRWRRDIGLVFLFGWLLYIPYMIATMAIFLKKTEFPEVLRKYTNGGYSFDEFSFASRFIWVMNLLLAIYFIRADRKSKQIKS